MSLYTLGGKIYCLNLWLYSCAFYRNGEMENEEMRAANAKPMPTSRLNLFKKKSGAIDQFVKPRDDFDLPASTAAAPQNMSMIP